MTVSQLMKLLDAKNLTPGVTLSGDISCGYACDLLSWVMAHGLPGMAWVTVQTHLNVIAVAVLMEFSCVILPENIAMEESSLMKAESEGIPVLQCSMTAYQICGIMASAGIAGADK